MSNKKNSTFKNIDINTFVSQICETIELACEKFWEQKTQVVLQAINEFSQIRNEKLILNTDFFSSQIKVENHNPITIRLSKEFIENILKATLKNPQTKFQFTKLTSLEIKILNGFCEFIYKKLKEILIPTEQAKLSEKSEKNINLLFIVNVENESCSKLMISIPQDRINFCELKKIKSFKDEDFLSSNTIVKIKAGSSKITFEELQNLAPDDIIILENSELSKLTLISGDIKQKINIKINPDLILDLNNNEDDEDIQNTYDEVKMEKNLWDDIQIEINAEFEKVKMTIGELKQITQGQIVDLGSIFDNEISLYVEERKVAKGELIIINDRYAVRLNEVLNSDTSKDALQVKVEASQAPQQPKPQPKPQPQKQVETQVEEQEELSDEDEEFDYSDFEK